jgi:hypothetical protein
MQKNYSILKTIIAVAIVLAMAQGCVPAGGNTPTPLNKFNINISSSFGFFANETKSKKIIIDGDTILFSTQAVYDAGSFHQFTTHFNNSSGFQYIKETRPSSLYGVFRKNAMAFDSNLVINNNMDTSYHWTNVGIDDIAFGGSTILTMGQHILIDMPFNSNKFVVFRKQKGTQYQYYWIRIRYTEFTNILNQFKYAKLDVIDGNYNLDSIVTGQ